MRAGLVLAAAMLLMACGDRQAVAVKDGVLQTGLPGVVTAGGRTSGEVVAAESPAAPASAASSALLAASAAALEAQQEQVALEQAQDRVATAWRARAAGPKP